MNNTFSLTPEKLSHPTPLDKYLVSLQSYGAMLVLY